MNIGKMKLKILCVQCTLIVSIWTSLGAQDHAARPQFEVASVRPTSKDQVDDPVLAKVLRDARQYSLRGGEIPTTSPDRVRLRGWTLLGLIAVAYSTPVTQVSGPSWLSDKSFDIEARVPDGTPKGQLNSMLQSLLEERFALRVHRITEFRRGYELTMGKGGAKLNPAKPTRDPSGKLNNDEVMQGLTAMTKRMNGNLNDNKSEAGLTVLSWSSITMEELAHRLGQFTEAPTVDRTGLPGHYSVTIEVSNDPDGIGNTVFDAVESLGLKLQPHDVPTETLVVDQVNKTPTEN